MYNESLKKQYINTRDFAVSTKEYATRLFNLLEPYETKWSKDLYEASDEELIDAMENAIGISSNTRGVAICTLRNYVKWCMDIGINNVSDSIFRIQIKGLDKVRTKMVSGPKHLQKYLDAIYDKEDEKTCDNIFRCFHWLAFMGVKESDVLQIKTTDVDLFNRTVRVGCSEYRIYEEAFDSFKYLKKLEWFVYKHKAYSKDIIRYRADGDLLMRGFRNVRSIEDFRNELPARRRIAISNGKIIKEKLSYLKLFKSGYFYRIYELERAGYIISFAELAEREMEGKTYSEKSGTTRAIMVEKARCALNDYELWKLAFDRQ